MSAAMSRSLRLRPCEAAQNGEGGGCTAALLTYDDADGLFDDVAGDSASRSGSVSAVCCAWWSAMLSTALPSEASPVARLTSAGSSKARAVRA